MKRHKMYCPKCGTQNEDNAFKYVQCNTVLRSAIATSSTQNIVFFMAIGSLILGILSIVTCFRVFAGIPAIILGFNVKKKNKLNPAPLESAIATLGIIFGIIGSLATLFNILVFWSFRRYFL